MKDAKWNDADAKRLNVLHSIGKTSVNCLSSSNVKESLRGFSRQFEISMNEVKEGREGIIEIGLRREIARIRRNIHEKRA